MKYCPNIVVTDVSHYTLGYLRITTGCLTSPKDSCRVTISVRALFMQDFSQNCNDGADRKYEEISAV
jgi:hypothetical protein